MNRAYLSFAEMAGLPGLPANLRSLQRMAQQQGWAAKCRRRPGRGGEMEFPAHLLPEAAQAALAARGAAHETDADGLWARFEALPDCDKARAAARLEALDAAERLMREAGLKRTAAMARIALERGLSPASLANWRAMVKGQPRAAWLAALAPNFKREADAAECHPDAWEMLASLWLRPSKPAFTACMRLMLREARKQGWSPIPSERSLRRRAEREIPRSVAVLAREGKDALRRLNPAQRRTVRDLHALRAVNMDGHKFDVFVAWPGHDKPIRPMMVMIQDLYSRKILAWRLADSENRDATRLAIGDMVSQWGIPEKLTLDNGRAFASKWITGGAKTRFRGKIGENDPHGLLTALGVETHFAKPARGQSKPIERAFGDLAEAISKHPACDGAYAGNGPDAKPENYGARAVDKALFEALIAQEIGEHNARPGRRTEMAAGRSFDAVFEESYSKAIIRWPSAGQKALWLMAAEKVRAQKGSGVIHFYSNRYWDRALNGHAGRDVVVRFDPANLHQPVKVYEMSGELICEAALIDDTGFYSHPDAHAAARLESGLLKATREQQRLIARIDAAALGRLALTHRLNDTPKPKPRVKRLVNGRMPIPEPVEEEPRGDAEQRFARGLRLVMGGLDD